jgi:hypothetical protein
MRLAGRSMLTHCTACQMVPVPLKVVGMVSKHPERAHFGPIQLLTTPTNFHPGVVLSLPGYHLRTAVIPS